jgi:hypothetical protein
VCFKQGPSWGHDFGVGDFFLYNIHNMSSAWPPIIMVINSRMTAIQNQALGGQHFGKIIINGAPMIFNILENILLRKILGHPWGRHCPPKYWASKIIDIQGRAQNDVINHVNIEGRAKNYLYSGACTK